MNYIISFPRSGQNIFSSILRSYAFHNGLEFSYCGYYKDGGGCGCEQSPCASGFLFQKNHDFNLDLVIKPEDRALVLFRRDKFEQIEAYFRFIFNLSEPVYSQDLLCKLKSFYLEQSSFYDGFLSKWGAKSRNRLILSYEELVGDPISQVMQVYRFFYPEADHSNDEEIFRKFKKKIERKNNLTISLGDIL